MGTGAAARCWWGKEIEERVLTEHFEWDDGEKLSLLAQLEQMCG